MPAYQIKFCTFTFVKQEDAYMNRIKEALDAKGISQTELANKLGKTFNIANLYATNRVQPLPLPVLYQIAETLKIDVHPLLIPYEIKE
jgi:putative transcriptional regulator